MAKLQISESQAKEIMAALSEAQQVLLREGDTAMAGRAMEMWEMLASKVQGVDRRMREKGKRE